jgi:hypothetical protein
MQLGDIFWAIDKEALVWHWWIDGSMTAQYAASLHTVSYSVKRHVGHDVQDFKKLRA